MLTLLSHILNLEQYRLAWPLCKDDIQIHEAFHIFNTIKYNLLKKKEPRLHGEMMDSVFKNYYSECFICSPNY